MHIEALRLFCVSKKGVTEEFPFDDNVMAFKVMGKVFALTGLNSWENGAPTINLKCNPERAIELRAEYGGIKPGYHMNKKHWNTVTVNDDELSETLIKDLINHSYELVVSGLTKKMKDELENL